MWGWKVILAEIFLIQNTIKTTVKRGLNETGHKYGNCLRWGRNAVPISWKSHEILQITQNKYFKTIQQKHWQIFFPLSAFFIKNIWRNFHCPGTLGRLVCEMTILLNKKKKRRKKGKLMQKHRAKST